MCNVSRGELNDSIGVVDCLEGIVKKCCKLNYY